MKFHRGMYRHAVDGTMTVVPIIVCSMILPDSYNVIL